MKSFWNTCKPSFSHTDMDHGSNAYKKRTKEWDTMFMSRLKEHGPIGRLVEYGIGNASLGVHAFLRSELSSYVGIDISKRSLDAAKKHLGRFRVPHELKMSDDTDSFRFEADTFVSQAVIQHFPDRPYLNRFLSMLNGSGTKKIMLQYRVNDEGSTAFSYDDYTTCQNVVRQCYTSSGYIGARLDKYKIAWVSEVQPRTQYQYCILTAKPSLGNVLFYGPGQNNECNLSDYDVIIITNHMGTLFPFVELDDMTKVWHMVNRLYTLSHMDDIRSSRADVIYGLDEDTVRRTLQSTSRPVVYLDRKIPSIRGMPLGLARMTNYVTSNYCFDRFDAVGVDFYEGEYVDGYKIPELTDDIDANDKKKHYIDDNVEFVRALSIRSMGRMSVPFPVSEHDTMVDQLDRDGYTKCESFLTSEDYDLLSSNVFKVVNAKHPENSAKMGFNELRRRGDKMVVNRRNKKRDGDEGMIDFWHIGAALGPKCNVILDSINRRVLQWIEGAFKVPYEHHNTNVYVNRSVTETRGIHADSNFWPSRIKYFLYLTDINDVHDGPFSIIRGSHRVGGDKYWRRYDITKPLTDDDVENYVVFDNLRRNDILVGCVSAGHRGMPQKKGRERVVIVGSFDPAPH